LDRGNMVRDKRNVITIILIVLVAAVGTRVVQQKYVLVDNDKTANSARVEIPRTIIIPDGETKDIVIPKSIINTSISDRPIEEFVEELEKGSENGEYYNNIEINENRTVTIKVTGKQLEHWIETTENILNKNLENAKKYMEVEISDDFQNVIYYVAENCTLQTWGVNSVGIQTQIAKAQVWIGTDAEDVKIYTIVIGKETNEKILEYSTSEGYQIEGEEWDAKVKRQD